MPTLRRTVTVWLAVVAALGAVDTAAAAAAAVAPRDDEAKQNFELRETIDGSFSASGLGAVWVSGDKLARNTNTGVVTVDVEGTEGDVLVPADQLTSPGSLGTWTVSQELDRVLCSFDSQAGFRHSTIAKYSVFDVSAKAWTHLETGSLLQTALLAPQGTGVAYVYENNIYYLADLSDDTTATKLTEDGTNEIYNGVPDWVYEEEVLSSGSAMWFSEGGTYLAYGQFNDTEVEEFSYIIYGNGKYTKVENLLYPKPGTDNPIVKLFVKSVKDNSERVELAPLTAMYTILQTVAWVSDEKVIAVWLNRIQNDVEVISYTRVVETEGEEVSWQPRLEFADDESDGWLDVGTPRVVNATSWLMLLPRKLDGEDQRFQRPTLISDANPVDFVTEKLTASALYGWNEELRRVYFQAAPAGQPGQRQVYSVDEHGSTLTCLSCEFTQPFEDSLCLYAAASFSTDFSHVAITCSGPGPAAVRLAKVEADGIQWVSEDYWQKNQNLLDKLNERNLPTVIGNLSYTVGDGLNAKARLLLPPNLDETKKYPMLVFVYGGPGSQQVSEAFSVNWGHYLTTSKDIIYASIDGRGSGFQGSKMLYSLYKKLGTVEVEDQIAVAKQLVEDYAFIDPTRVGIWGWSYGGYASAMAMAKDDEHVFACGAAVAPVTAWELYDTIYTERYMDEPVNNQEGYDNANVSAKIENFKTHEFYMLHGNADDNVHYQQAMRLARVLEENNVYFDSQSYPDENHSIRSVVTHVYTSLTVFFDRCFVDVEEVAVETTTKGAASVLPAILLVFLSLFGYLLS